MRKYSRPVEGERGGGGVASVAQDRRGAQGEHGHEHHLDPDYDDHDVDDPGVDDHDNNVHDGPHHDDGLYISILR